jgi:hypothetical protein
MSRKTIKSKKTNKISNEDYELSSSLFKESLIKIISTSKDKAFQCQLLAKLNTISMNDLKVKLDFLIVNLRLNEEKSETKIKDELSISENHFFDPPKSDFDDLKLIDKSETNSSCSEDEFLANEQIKSEQKTHDLEFFDYDENHQNEIKDFEDIFQENFDDENREDFNFLEHRDLFN